MTTEVKVDLKKKSRVVTDGPDRAGARAMLRATGLNDEDMDKPFVAVGNLASDITPCNVHLNRQALKVKEGLRASLAVFLSCLEQSRSVTVFRWGRRA